MKHVGIILALVGAIITSQAQDTVSVFFDKDSYVVKSREANKIVEFLESKDNCQLKLTGHTDSDGSDEYNVALSKNRVEAVKGVLKLNESTHEWYGEQFARDESTGEPVKSGDRRVDVIATCPVVTYEIEETSTEEIILEEQTQTFEIDASRKNVVVGKKGTKIYIPAHAFEELNGSKCTGKLTVHLKEFYKKSEFILNDLTTASNEHIIESGGMIDLRVKGKKGDVKLAKGEEIRLDFNGNQQKKGMEVFYVDDRRNMKMVRSAPMNWVPNSFAVDSYRIAYDGVIPRVGDWTESSVKRGDDGRYLRITSKYNGPPAKLVDRDTTDVTAEYVAQNEFLAINRLGLINCDRFLDSEERLVDQLVERKPVEGVKPVMYLVFEDINSVMPVYYQRGAYCFPNIPLKKRAKIISILTSGDGFLYAEKDIRASGDFMASLNDYEKLSKAEFKKKLEQLD